MAGKRGDGEGWIGQRPNGTWEAKISLPGGGRKSVYAATKREVKEKLAVVQADIKAGKPVTTRELTVSSYLDDWIRGAALRVRPRTVERYQYSIDKHIRPHLGATRLTALAPRPVQKWLDTLVERGLSVATVTIIRSTLSKALEDARRWELIERNPVSLTSLPSVGYKRRAAMTPEQARAILGASEGSRLATLYTLALWTGLRRGEALGLRWKAVDWSAPSLTVEYTLQSLRGEPVLAPPKSESGRRTIPLAPPAVEALRAERGRQDAWRKTAGPAWRDTGLVFTTQDGGPLGARYITHDFTKVLARAGLPHIRFHDLRHGFATLSTAAGVHPRELMELMGHSSIRVGQDLYVHVSPEMAGGAIRQLATLMGGENTTTVRQQAPKRAPRPRKGSADQPGAAGL